MLEKNPRVSLRPRWETGQSWQVEYLTLVPSAKGAAVQTLPLPYRTVWKYEVTSQVNDEPIVLSVTEEDGDGLFELSFDPENLTLRSIVSIEEGEREEVDEIVPSQAYFGWSQAHRVIFDWPRFPDTLERASHTFKTAEDEEVEQALYPAPNGAFEIVFTLREEEEGEGTTRSRQTWLPGELWWRHASVEVEYADGEESETVVSVEANIIGLGD